MTIPPRLAALARNDAVRWVAFVALTWVMLKPALLVTISGDDLVNPFSVLADYGPNPLSSLGAVNRDVLDFGHFNFIGQTIGAVVFRSFTYVISAGVRYSFLYALVKLVVFVAAAVASARLLRTLVESTGRTMGVWTSRVAVALVLFGTLQLHIAWSLDPVGSFPLSGYLSVVVGVLALDVALRAIATEQWQRWALAAVALCGAILYYEINVAMAVALVPVVLLQLRRIGPRPALGRAAAILVPPAVMTVVLQRIAAAANDGYTGTDVAGVGDGAAPTLARALGGSLPASAWGTAAEWLDGGLGVSLAGVLCGLVAAAVVAIAASRLRARPAPSHRDVLVIACVPILVWVVATLVQASTEKVQQETRQLGYVYNFYAYGSVALALAVILLAALLPLHRLRAPLAVAAAAFVFVQINVNDLVQREFGVDFRISRDLLASYTDEAPRGERCAEIERWRSIGYLPPDRIESLVRGLDAANVHFRGEPFC